MIIGTEPDGRTHLDVMFYCMRNTNGLSFDDFDAKVAEVITEIKNMGYKFEHMDRTTVLYFENQLDAMEVFVHYGRLEEKKNNGTK